MVPIDELESYPRASRSRRVLVLFGIGLAAAALAIYAVSKPAPETSGAGDQAPEFELPLLGGGGTISSDELRGKPVVLNFWASYCISCKEEAPILDEAWRRYRDQGVMVIGVNAQRDSDAAALRFAEAFGMTFPLVKDDGSLAAALDVDDRFLPQTLYVDADWQLAGVYSGDVLTDETSSVVLGPVTESGLREQIEQMLASS